MTKNVMKTVTVTTGYRIVTPCELRRQLNIQVGQKLNTRIQGGHIELKPLMPTTAARGFLPGLDTEVTREE